ncbi:MAG: NAD-dependent epimerase/dehydratase family protein, partial [Candidatus Micrarchaeia archaeon]
MKFIVTGGAGFIGSNLVETLVKKGHEVIVVDNLHTGNLQNLNGVSSSIKFVKANAGEVATLKEDSIDGIFHLGVYSSSPMYKQDRSLMVKALEDWTRILEFATKNNTKIVLVSSSSLYNGNPLPWKENMPIIPTDFYTETRYMMERIGKVYNELYDTKIIVLRLFSVYGEKEEFKKEYANLITQFIQKTLKGEPIKIYGDGTQSRDFIYVKDVVDALIKAMECGEDFEVFNVGKGEKYSMNEILEKINKVLKVEAKVEYVENPIKNYVTHTLADTTKAEEKLGFKAKTSVEEGIRRIIP